MKSLKSLFSTTVILAGLIFASMTSSLSAQPFASGTGTEADPYVVSTGEQLDNVRTSPESHYKLGADIDLTTWITTNSSTKGWTPIGDVTTPFSGTFDGDGHVISGIWSTQTVNNVGLFGVISGTVSIKKLGVVVADGYKMKGVENVGIIAGLATNVPSGTKEVVFDQVFALGSVEATSKFAGGILGFNNWMHLTITNCYAGGSVLSGGNGTGGLLGNSWGSVQILIDRSYTQNDLTCNDGSAGGIAGAVSATATADLNFTISNCVAINKSITVNSASFGRIYGWVKDEKITLINNQAFDGMMINEGTVSGSATTIHGLDRTEDELAQQATYDTWDFSLFWKMTNNSYQLPVLKNITLSKQPIERVDLSVHDDNPFKDLVDMFGTLNVVDQCGANPNGRVDNTEIIQLAVDACSAKKATLIFPQGRYLTRPIFLKSNMTLDLKEGATILGSKVKKDYDDAFPGAGAIETSALIYGKDIMNVKITGKGKINGQGDAPDFQLGNGGSGRPKVLHFIRCQNVTVEGVELLNSAFWTAHFLLCDGVKIKGVKIYSHTNWNNDGLDIDSKNVEIEDCDIDCDDDGICMKSDRGIPCENVTIKNCTIRTNCNAIKLGTAGKSGFKNISYSNCMIGKASEDNFRKHNQNYNLSWAGIQTSPSVISGIALESVDGGILEDVTISDITMTDVHNAIFLRLGERAKGSNGEISQLKNVTISDVKATTVSKIAAGIIAGTPDAIVENVLIKNVEITMPGGGTTSDAKATVPEVKDKYPECSMFGIVLPAYGFYVRHAKDIFFENVKFNLQGNDGRPDYKFDDVTNYVITGIKNVTKDDNMHVFQTGDQLQLSPNVTGQIQIQLINSAGVIVYSTGKTAVSPNETISVNAPAPGMYMLLVQTNDAGFVKKFIVK